MRVALAAPPRTLDGSDWEREQAEAVDEAERYLLEMAGSLSGQVAVETIAPYGHAAPPILEAATHCAANGIIMATHGRTGLPHLLYGSVTEAVLANSSVPAFVVYARPGEQAAAPFAPYSARVLVPVQNGSCATREGGL